MNNFDWIKDSARIFIDQNLKQNIRDWLIKRGYKNVYSVCSINYAGANDGKLLKIIKDRKLILVTKDKHFYKACLKYNQNMGILIGRSQTGTEYGIKSIINQIQTYLLKNFKAVQSYYTVERRLEKDE